MADVKSRSMTGRTDWKLHTKVFQQIDKKWVTTGGGPVCILSGHTSALFLQLEARFTGQHDRCFQPGLGSGKGLCKPSMVPNRESSVTVVI